MVAQIQAGARVNMDTLYLMGLAALCVGLAVWLGLRTARKAGAAQAREKGARKVIENVDAAKRAVDSLDRDPDKRDELRKRRQRD